MFRNKFEFRLIFIKICLINFEASQFKGLHIALNGKFQFKKSKMDDIHYYLINSYEENIPSTYLI